MPEVARTPAACLLTECTCPLIYSPFPSRMAYFEGDLHTQHGGHCTVDTSCSTVLEIRMPSQSYPGWIGSFTTVTCVTTGCSACQRSAPRLPLARPLRYAKVNTKIVHSSHRNVSSPLVALIPPPSPP